MPLTCPHGTVPMARDPNTSEKFDVVIIELKREGIDIDKTLGVERQLTGRARELYSHFWERIQRMWFYGIIELSEAVELELGPKELIY